MVDTTKYKSVAIKIPYYDALVRMGLTKHRGPGQEMMHMIRKEATTRGIRIRDKGIIKSKRRDNRKVRNKRFKSKGRWQKSK